MIDEINTMLKSSKLQILLLWFQGGYFFITGIWPILHTDSFLAVTGPKTDIWLVKTVATLITVISLSILISAFQRKLFLPVITSAILSALSLMMVDIVYVFKDVISPIYLADALAELLIVLA